MREVAPDVFMLEDSCRVYALRREGTGVLIDFGTGLVLGRLERLGLRRDPEVLLTHHHRDQASGLLAPAASRLRIWAPHQEQDLIARVEAHWQAREVANSYNNRQDRFSLLEPRPLAGTLQDHARYTFAGRAFEVLPTPGHTPGSVTLLTEAEGQQLAFVGDLLAAPGKLWSLAATQWSYNGAEGVAATIASLLALRERAPDLLLPSHGDPISEPQAAIDLLVERLWALLRARGENPRLFRLRDEPYLRLTPHLLWNRTSLAYGYALLSESGKALLFDYGYDFTTGLAAGADRAARRPWLYTLPALKREYGVREVSAVVATHYHDDHVAGFNLLRSAEGAEVWASDDVAAILEAPARFDLPCLWYDPIPVDRRLPLGEPVAWEEHSFTLFAQPGHTSHAVAIFLEVDGQRVVLAGDQYQNGAEAKWNYVYNNGFDLADYQESAARYRTLAPDLVLTGHWAPYRLEPGYLETLERRGDELRALHQDLLPPEAWATVGADRVARLEPYQSAVAPGGRLRLTAALRHGFAASQPARLALELPEGWRAEPAVAEFEAAPGGVYRVPFTLTVGPRPGRRQRVGLALWLGGRPWGQVAEALATVR